MTSNRGSKPAFENLSVDYFSQLRTFTNQHRHNPVQMTLENSLESNVSVTTIDVMMIETSSSVTHQKSQSDLKSNCSTTLKDAFSKRIDNPSIQPIRRFRRRNSAVASMLFPTVQSATLEELSRATPDGLTKLDLSYSIKSLNSLEVLEKARGIVENTLKSSTVDHSSDHPSDSCDDKEHEEQGRRKRRKNTGATE